MDFYGKKGGELMATDDSTRFDRLIKSAEEILQAHLDDLDADAERIKAERQRTQAAISAFTPRCKPERPAKDAA